MRSKLFFNLFWGCLLGLIISTNALAFGGGGHGLKSTYYKGVHSVGIHQGGEEQADVDFRDCTDNETFIAGVCCPNDRILDENTCVSDGDAEIVYAIMKTIKDHVDALNIDNIFPVENHPDYVVEIYTMGSLIDVWIYKADETALKSSLLQALSAKLLSSDQSWYVGDEMKAYKTMADVPETTEYMEWVIEPTWANRPTQEYRDIDDWYRPLHCDASISTCDPCVENDGWPTKVKTIKWGQSCTNADQTTGQCTWNGTCENLCTGVSCGAGTTCSMGKCVCPNGEEPCNGTCCAEGQVCSDLTYGVCVQATGDCTSNHDCTYDQYCQVTCQSGFDTATPGCCQTFKGTCTKRSIPTPKQLDFDGDGTNETTLYSGPRINYWALRNYCVSFGKNPFDVSNNRMGCRNPQLGTPNQYKGGTCYDPNTTGTTWDDHAQSFKELEDWRNAHTYENTSCFASGTTSQQCRRYFIHLGYGFVHAHKDFDRFNQNFDALCE